MALTIILVSSCLAGIWYGRRNKNKTLVRASVIGLAVIAILLALYMYAYSKNPY